MKVFLIAALLAAALAPADLYRSLPSVLKGWKAAGDDEVFDRKTLYRHINGGAELYLTFDFREVLVRRFEHPEKPGMLLEVFDMGNSADAFGVFSCERDGEELGIGQGSEYAGGLLRFWKDRYFVAVTSLGDEELTKHAVAALGTIVADLISSTGALPPLIDRLPREYLQEASIRYFHAAQSLNNIYYLASENILQLDNATECVCARYGSGEGAALLLVVRYPDDRRAAEAAETFLAQYVPEARETGYARMEDGTWTAVAARSRLVSIVFESSSAEEANRLVSGVNNDE
ncbi:MAG: hypothetical protein HY770_07600 [Chitinivibrionia bacterium]|nr:hypothetical protein [Chitinivibrionia bacterium]